MSLALELIAPVAGAITTTIAATLSAWKRRPRYIIKTAGVTVGPFVLANSKVVDAVNSAPIRDFSAEVRLHEINQALEYEEALKTQYRFADAFLVFGQFIIGGALTSSFVRSQSEFVIGLLGLVVLASSLISRHFRPDLLYKSSAIKLHRLRILKRNVEDALYEAPKLDVNHDARILALRKWVTNELQQIERADLQFLEVHQSSTPASPHQ